MYLTLFTILNTNYILQTVQFSPKVAIKNYGKQVYVRWKKELLYNILSLSLSQTYII